MSLLNFFTGGVVEGVTDIAKEWIDTDKESAEAKAIMVKTLDPNGVMRREISRKVTQMYMVYIYMTVILVLAQSFQVGDAENVKSAIKSLTDLFIPITAMFSAIVGASFGVNGLNSLKAKA